MQPRSVAIRGVARDRVPGACGRDGQQPSIGRLVERVARAIAEYPAGDDWKKARRRCRWQAHPMKRRPPTAEELELARQAASEARVRAGLPAIDPDDLEWERRLAERKRKRPKGKR